MMLSCMKLVFYGTYYGTLPYNLLFLQLFLSSLPTINGRKQGVFDIYFNLNATVLKPIIMR